MPQDRHDVAIEKPRKRCRSALAVLAKPHQTRQSVADGARPARDPRNAHLPRIGEHPFISSGKSSYPTLSLIARIATAGMPLVPRPRQERRSFPFPPHRPMRRECCFSSAPSRPRDRQCRNRSTTVAPHSAAKETSDRYCPVSGCVAFLRVPENTGAPPERRPALYSGLQSRPPSPMRCRHPANRIAPYRLRTLRAQSLPGARSRTHAQSSRRSSATKRLVRSTATARGEICAQSAPGREFRFQRKCDQNFHQQSAQPPKTPAEHADSYQSHAACGVRRSTCRAGRLCSPAASIPAHGALQRGFDGARACSPVPFPPCRWRRTSGGATSSRPRRESAARGRSAAKTTRPHIQRPAQRHAAGARAAPAGP